MQRPLRLGARGNGAWEDAGRAGQRGEGENQPLAGHRLPPQRCQARPGHRGSAPPPSSLHQILSFLTGSTARLVPNLGPGMGRVWGLHESCNFSGTFCISKPRVVVSGAQLPKVAPDVFLGCLDNKPAPMGSLHPDPRERRSDSVG